MNTDLHARLYTVDKHRCGETRTVTCTCPHKQHARPAKGWWQLAEIASINHPSDRFKFYLPAIHAVKCSCNHTRVRPLPRMHLFGKLSSWLTNALSKHKLQAPFCPSQRIRSVVYSRGRTDNMEQEFQLWKKHHHPCKCIDFCSCNQVTLILKCPYWKWRAAKIYHHIPISN